MGLQAGNPLVGGTQLRRAAMSSPNYVPGTSGWSVNIDGSAEFRDIVLPDGVTGNTVTIGAVAPSSPRQGDLWLDTAAGLELNQWDGSAWVPYQFGTDAIADGSITTALVNFTARDIGGITTTVSATAPASPQDGDLWYDSSNGYKLNQYESGAWTAYQFGTNAIEAGSITAALIAANTITAAQLAAGIVYAGIINGTTVTGSTLENSATDPKTSINPDGSIKITNSSGDVIFEIGPDGTTTWYSAAGGQLMQLSPTGVISVTDPAALEFPSGSSFENNVAAIAVGVGGTSPAQFIQLLIESANTNTAGAHDKVYAEFNSAAADNSSDANLELVYQGSNGNSHEYASMDGTGFNILAGSATGAHPGTTPAVPESWQSISVSGSPAWSGTLFYKKTLENEVMIVAQLTAPSSTPINNNAFATLPAGYRPSAAGISFGITSSSGTNPRCTLGTDGTVQTNGVSSTGSTVWIGPIRIPLDL